MCRPHAKTISITPYAILAGTTRCANFFVMSIWLRMVTLLQVWRIEYLHYFFQCKLLIGHLCVKLIENTYIILKNVSLSHKSFLFNITMRDVNQEARRYSYNVFRLRFQLWNLLERSLFCSTRSLLDGRRQRLNKI